MDAGAEAGPQGCPGELSEFGHSGRDSRASGMDPRKDVRVWVCSRDLYQNLRIYPRGLSRISEGGRF